MYAYEYKYIDHRLTKITLIGKITIKIDRRHLKCICIKNTKKQIKFNYSNNKNNETVINKWQTSRRRHVYWKNEKCRKNHKINCVINNNVKMLWMKIKKKYIHKYMNERKNKRLKIKFYFYFLDGLK